MRHIFNEHGDYVVLGCRVSDITDEAKSYIDKYAPELTDKNKQILFQLLSAIDYVSWSEIVEMGER